MKLSELIQYIQVVSGIFFFVRLGLFFVMLFILVLPFEYFDRKDAFQVENTLCLKIGDGLGNLTSYEHFR